LQACIADFPGFGHDIARHGRQSGFVRNECGAFAGRKQGRTRPTKATECLNMQANVSPCRQVLSTRLRTGMRTRGPVRHRHHPGLRMPLAPHRFGEDHEKVHGASLSLTPGPNGRRKPRLPMEAIRPFSS
jgi:hypothetical protein